VDGEVDTHVIVGGWPPRTLPLDLHIRSLGAEEAQAAGRRQGAAGGADFPIYGLPTVGWRSARCLEIDFAGHGTLNGKAGSALVDFQRGALQTAFARLVPTYRVQLSSRVGPESVRFRAEFDRKVVPHVPLEATTVLEASGSGAQPLLSELEDAILQELGPAPITYRELFALIEKRCLEAKLEFTERRLAAYVRRLAARGLIAPPLSADPNEFRAVTEILLAAVVRPSEFPALPAQKRGRDGSAGSRLATNRLHGVEPRPSARLDRVLAAVVGGGTESARSGRALRGLDSLPLLELLVRIEREFGVSLSASAVADGPLTRARLAALIDAAAAETGDLRSRRRPARGRPPRPASEDWRGFDLSTLLRRNLQSPRSRWAFKHIRSEAPFDYEYLSWPDLGRRARAHALELQAAGLGPGEVATIVLPQSLDLVCVWVACVLSGTVPSICAAPGLKLTQLEFESWFAQLISRNGSKAVVCAASQQPSIRRALRGASLEVPLVTPARGESDDPWPETAAGLPDRPVILQHSSGTTGLQKAVLLSERQVLAQTAELARRLRCDSEDVIVSWLPLYHDMGLMACLALPLLCSIPTVMMSPFDWVRRPELLLEQITEERGTLCWLPNFAYLHCANRVDDAAVDDYDLSSLRCLINCSEPITASAHAAFLSKFSRAGFDPRALSASYAMAESTFAVTQCPPSELPELRVDRTAFSAAGRVVPASSEDALALVSSGQALPGITLEVVDPAGTLLPDGSVGEIRVRGEVVVTEYHRDPEATRAAMREGFYYTGDRGFLWSGDLFVTGRQKDVVIIAGVNLYPHDVEELVARIDGVRAGRVAAFGLWDEGMGTERLVVVAEVQGSATETIRREVRRVVSAHFGVVPGEVILRRDRVLPKSTSGKLSRERCRSAYLAGELGQGLVPKAVRHARPGRRATLRPPRGQC
jgi:acyl-CoA synthetase (AMP-forming)/AMP-acid ligase II